MSNIIKPLIVLACLFGMVFGFSETTDGFQVETTQSSSEENVITGIPFDCTGKPTGFYRDTNYCDIFHVCVSFQQKKTYACPQIGDQFFYDEKIKMCEFKSRNPNGCPLNNYYQQVQISQETTNAAIYTEDVPKWKEFVRQSDDFSCYAKEDGFYPSRWCNVFYRCSSNSKFEFLCAKQQNGDRLWWTEHSTSQITPKESAQCAFPCNIKAPCISPGGVIVESENGNVVTESVKDVVRIQEACKKTEVSNSAVDHSNDIFRLPASESSSESSCAGKSDGTFQGDDKYCNVFHVCYAGTKRDFLCAKALNSNYELWWDESKKRCDWPCKVKCNKQVFGGNQNAAEIQRTDNLINAADCQITVKTIRYKFANRFYK